MRTNYLGGHPEYRSLHVVGDIVAVDVVGLLGDAEVRDLARAVNIEQNIIGFQVAVENAFGVQVCQPSERL